MPDISKILRKIEDGDPSATDQLLPLVYDELRALAAAKLRHEKTGDSLQATALVHEAYLKLIGPKPSIAWESRGHFFAAAAESMRRILINRARDKRRLKRGGNLARLDLSKVSEPFSTPEELLIDLDEAIAELATRDPESADLVRLRFFAGLSLQDAAECLGLSRRQGDRLWAFARAWLYDFMRQD